MSMQSSSGFLPKFLSIIIVLSVNIKLKKAVDVEEKYLKIPIDKEKIRNVRTSSIIALLRPLVQ